MKSANDLQIIKKSVSGSDKKYLLKLNRSNQCLEIYEKVSNNKLLDYHSIREDFETSNYVLFEKYKEFSCICGGDDSQTPCGIFNIENKSKNFYISTYHKDYDKVKFLGYLVIFEDYFIHSNMYLMDIEESDIRNGSAKTISVDDKFTQGCVRVEQDALDWLVDNIDVGTITVL